MLRDAKRKNEVIVYLLAAGILIVFVVVTILALKFVFGLIDSKEIVEEETTTIIEQPVPAKQYEYGLKYSNCNIYLTVDGRRTGDDFVNVRSQPGMSDKYKIGQVADKAQFVANCLYAYSDPNNEFIGFPVESLDGVVNVEDGDDGDNIVWMSLYYVYVEVYDYPETYKDDPKRPYETTDFTKVEIVGEESPNIRATPCTGDKGNIYGVLPVGTVIELSDGARLLLNDTNTFVGIPLVAGSLEGVIESRGYGHIYYDQDYILWVSLDYAKLS